MTAVSQNVGGMKRVRRDATTDPIDWWMTAL